MRTAVLLLAAVVACGEKAPVETPEPAKPAPTPAPAPTAPAIDAAVAVAPTPPPPPAPEPPKGFDFIDDINVLYRVAACGNPDSPLPDRLTHGDTKRAAALQAVVDRHCKAMKKDMDKYREDYFHVAREWFVAHQPKDLPKRVVYGFGGGDLVSALVAFPDATEITTVSLELAGDPRKVDQLSPDQLANELAEFRREIGGLIWVGSNLSTNLSGQQGLHIAAQLSSHLLGMATGGYEPVSARFFALDDDGAIHYFEQDEVDADKKSGHSLSSQWRDPAFAQAFGNVEITYRAIGSTDTRVFRHIGWNLGNDYLTKHAGLIKHLEAKGTVAILVKGASYLLWLDDFSMFRQYMIDHLAWMITDSTGLAPNYADAAGTLEQVAYGKFDGPPSAVGGMAGKPGDKACRKKWSASTEKMPFRFGYLDAVGHAHTMITTRKAK